MKKILQSRKNLSWMLKAVTLLAFAGVLFAGLVPVPQFAEHVAHFWPDYEDFATAAVIYVNVGFVPFYGALVLAWQVFSAIGRDESFTRANARRVRVASWLALAEVAYLLGGLIWFGTRRALSGSDDIAGVPGADTAGPGRGCAVLCPVGADFAGGGNEGRSRPDHLRRRPC